MISEMSELSLVVPSHLISAPADLTAEVTVVKGRPMVTRHLSNAGKRMTTQQRGASPSASNHNCLTYSYQCAP